MIKYNEAFHVVKHNGMLAYAKQTIQFLIRTVSEQSFVSGKFNNIYKNEIEIIGYLILDHMVSCTAGRNP